VRLCAAWADGERTLMYVFEAAEPVGRSVFRLVAYDETYTPLHLKR
jgi:hypothetical protein